MYAVELCLLIAVAAFDSGVVSTASPTLLLSPSGFASSRSLSSMNLSLFAVAVVASDSGVVSSASPTFLLSPSGFALSRSSFFRERVAVAAAVRHHNLRRHHLLQDSFLP